MAATQLNFTLRTSTNVKTAHLVGSWDNYSGQLPLSKDNSKAGAWKGTFRFSASTLKAGQRYWYYVRFSPLRSPQKFDPDYEISTLWMVITFLMTQLNHSLKNLQLAAF